MAVEYLIERLWWPAVVLAFPDSGDPTIFVINDYENFFVDAEGSGDEVTADRDTMERAWIDRVDLIFVWERLVYSEGTATERPLIGSQREAYGDLLTQIDSLK